MEFSPLGIGIFAGGAIFLITMLLLPALLAKGEIKAVHAAKGLLALAASTLALNLIYLTCCGPGCINGHSNSVLSVLPNSPASQAGLMSGDLILTVSGNPVHDSGGMAAFDNALVKLSFPNALYLTIKRGENPEQQVPLYLYRETRSVVATGIVPEILRHPVSLSELPGALDTFLSRQIEMVLSLTGISDWTQQRSQFFPEVSVFDSLVEMLTMGLILSVVGLGLIAPIAHYLFKVTLKLRLQDQTLAPSISIREDSI